MRYNLKRLFAWVTLLTVTLAVFRRPLAWVADQSVSNGMWQAFLNPLRHLAWLVGCDVQYYPGGEGVLIKSSGRWILTGNEKIGLLVGTGVSIGLHLVIMFCVISGITWLMLWSEPEKVAHKDYNWDYEL